ncbi:universal stress protein [Desulfuromonas thiophila]|uniref:Nucleotide-binding universal stress protein, UspA family n=1 Tax=Desulfuromonas thiophila TaxID=57664 RepID=A0A1G6WYL3_9BACT|nr:universal stress protein [Desulfuromonas thiophila]SDD71002.1 Nucleotide-binding universal stress protein, UspA family [Desulfuromonas thiophila]
MILLAHDGSIYGDWLARYALHFAAAEEDRQLLALHVRDGRIPAERLASRWQRLEQEGAAAAVSCRLEVLRLRHGVAHSLLQAVPSGPPRLLLCGTRFRPRQQGFLTGSVAETLLRNSQGPVLALRIVQPGLLGSPQSLLLPLTPPHCSLSPLEPLIRHLLPQLGVLHLFQAVTVNRLRHVCLSATLEDELRHKGHHQLASIREKLETTFAPLPLRCDQRVTLTSDWAQEVLLQAHRLKSQLLLLGLPRRALIRRVLQRRALETILRHTPCDVGIYPEP